MNLMRKLRVGSFDTECLVFEYGKANASVAAHFKMQLFCATFYHAP